MFGKAANDDTSTLLVYHLEITLEEEFADATLFPDAAQALRKCLMRRPALNLCLLR